MDDEIKKLPIHVGIIMDGNGRWAKEKNLPRSLGHKEGANNLRKLLPYIYDRGVHYVTIYAFSSENFNRSKEEVDYLMNLFSKQFRTHYKTIIDRGVKVVFSGRKEPIPEDVWDSMNYLMDVTKDGKNGVLNICLNYGGDNEIVDMVKKVSELVVEGNITIEDIDKQIVKNNLYCIMPEIDLMIRTSGEQRSSNFMLYQAAYAEYYFPKTYFPDFDKKEFELSLLEYNKRNRRFGGN